MSELYPTKTRLRFLAHVQAGWVTVDWYGVAKYSDEQGGRCSSLWQQCAKAGWVARPNAEERWVAGQLTEAGQLVLDTGRGVTTIDTGGAL